MSHPDPNEVFESLLNPEFRELHLDVISDEFARLEAEDSPIISLILAFGASAHRSSLDWAALEHLIGEVIARAREKQRKRNACPSATTTPT